MNKRTLIIFSIIIVGISLWSVPKLQPFLKVDDCLDKGGKWDNKSHNCVFEEKVKGDELNLSETDSTPSLDRTINDYYAIDTITIKQYVSDNNNSITLTGSKSGDPYSISIESNKGFKRIYQYTEHWYTASHSHILWDNDDFVLITFGCGTACYNAIAIPINSDKPPMELNSVIYTDSLENIVLFTNHNSVTGKNLLTEKTKTIELDLCSELSLFESIDYVDMDQKGETVFIYSTRNCKDEGKDFFNFKELIE